ncbi:MAG: DUF4388 domain-containing protein [Nitrospirae bacterium]|nr:DUF4388 domain-containing protein [Nitrospirota bacterium]
MEEIPLSGNIKDYSLPQILEYLQRLKKRGILKVKASGIEKAIYLKDGQIVFASSNLIADRLGEMLVRAGKITPPQLVTAGKILKESGRKLGAIMVDAGFITPKQLFWGLKFQVKEIIYSLFLLDEGDYKFTDGGYSNDIIVLHIDTAQLITEIIKKMEEVE